MARVRVPSFALGVAFVCAACRPAESGTAEPVSVGPAAEPAAPSQDDVAKADVVDDGRFAVTLTSRCAEVWKATLVPQPDAAPPPGPRSFEVRSASLHELRLLSGDAIVLTTPDGGIMAVSFEDHAANYDARVEVTPECTGVRRTVVRNAPSAADL